jgi:hypothetical protein
MSNEINLNVETGCDQPMTFNIKVRPVPSDGPTTVQADSTQTYREVIANVEGVDNPDDYEVTNASGQPVSLDDTADSSTGMVFITPKKGHEGN